MNLNCEVKSIVNDYFADTKYHFSYHINDSESGISIYIFEVGGGALIRMSWNDTESCAYIDSLSVNENLRKKNIATILLNMSERIAFLNNKNAVLYVRKGSWIVKWYERLGYKNTHASECDEYHEMLKVLPEKIIFTPVKRTRYHLSTNIQGLLSLYKGKSMKGILSDDKGEELSDLEIREYLNECVEKGWKLIPHCDPKECPDFDYFGHGCPGHSVNIEEKEGMV